MHPRLVLLPGMEVILPRFSPESFPALVAGENRMTMRVTLATWGEDAEGGLEFGQWWGWGSPDPWAGAL